jgi:hypothetical protein
MTLPPTAGDRESAAGRASLERRPSEFDARMLSVFVIGRLSQMRLRRTGARERPTAENPTKVSSIQSTVRRDLSQ